MQVLPWYVLYCVVKTVRVAELGGRLSRCFEPRSGTRGLWSVSIKNCFPSTYIENVSHAHVVASASFSIWAYQHSISDIERDANTTGLQLSSFCRSTAPSP